MKGNLHHLVVTSLSLLLLIGLVGCGLPSPSDPGSDAATPTLSATPVPSLAERSPATVTPLPTAEPLDEQPGPTPTPARRARTYIVQPGDTLSGIAHEYNVPVSDLVTANGIENPDEIWAGQHLVIPGNANPSVAQAPTPPTAALWPIPSATLPGLSATTGETSSAEPTVEPPSIAGTPSPHVELEPLPPRALLGPMKHEWQKMNNCAPATLAMGLSYYEYELTQFDLAPILKGGAQDKHVTPEEIVPYLHEIGLGGRVRVDGDIETLQRLVANGVPVMVEQWLDRPDDELTGHYRLVRGYDREAEVVTVNDSYSGPELRFPFAEFDRLWRAFNRLYIPIYRPDQEPLVQEVIGEDWDDETMYRKALATAQREVQEVGDLYAWFNLGDDHLGLGQGEEAVAAFERALAFGLPPRMLWYRFGPFKAYNRTKQYQKTLDLAAPLLVTVPMLEEAHYQQGVAYERLGWLEEAIGAYQRALQYNARFQLAQEALTRVRESGGE